MNHNSRKEMIKALKGVSLAELQKSKADAEAILQSDPERLDAKEAIEVLDELIAKAGGKPATGAAAELAAIKSREAKIREKIARSGGALTRAQAEASVANQEKFDALQGE